MLLDYFIICTSRYHLYYYVYNYVNMSILLMLTPIFLRNTVISFYFHVGSPLILVYKSDIYFDERPYLNNKNFF